MKIIFIAFLTAALGLWLFNTFIEWRYNAQLLSGPCQLCVSLNPEWAQCYELLSSHPLAFVYNPNNTVQHWNTNNE